LLPTKAFGTLLMWRSSKFRVGSRTCDQDLFVKLDSMSVSGYIEPRRHPGGCFSQKELVVMLADVLVALLIVAVAAVLGLVVHPVLWFIAVLALIYLFTRHSGSRSHSAV
jgi:hypothetical protein